MITIGDKVKILNESAEGTVKKILSLKIALVRVGDFDYEYSIGNLVKKEDLEGNSDSFSQNFSSKQIHPKIKEIISEKEQLAENKIKLKKGKKSSFIREIDLHCHEIIEDSSGMNNSQILDFQLNYFIRELDYAIVRKEKNIIFIHGKGEGILKAEIHRILNSYENIIFYDAPLRFYGGGATQVEIY